MESFAPSQCPTKRLKSQRREQRGAYGEGTVAMRKDAGCELTSLLHSGARLLGPASKGSPRSSAWDRAERFGFASLVLKDCFIWEDRLRYSLGSKTYLQRPAVEATCLQTCAHTGKLLVKPWQPRLWTLLGCPNVFSPVHLLPAHSLSNANRVQQGRL